MFSSACICYTWQERRKFLNCSGTLNIHSFVDKEFVLWGEKKDNGTGEDQNENYFSLPFEVVFYLPQLGNQEIICYSVLRDSSTYPMHYWNCTQGTHVKFKVMDRTWGCHPINIRINNIQTTLSTTFISNTHSSDRQRKDALALFIYNSRLLQTEFCFYNLL